MAIKQTKTSLAAHTAGIFADMTLDGPEIGTLVAVVDRAKNLPNRKTMGKQDPYCAMRLGKEAKKTDTDRRGGQTPKWDQELRFTVHDSPDYYKLKISVFNDDKKTDLIGEAYVDLSDLIRPGGGSNDLWHQLNYKGKYAGDIRMEMTYYDTRPREEKPSEKRRHRDKVSSVSGEGIKTLSGPRQLGPRDVKRRPLPASPGDTTPSPITTPQSIPPQPPPKIPFESSPDYASTPPTSQSASDSYIQDYGLGQERQQDDFYEYQMKHSYQSQPEHQRNMSHERPQDYFRTSTGSSKPLPSSMLPTLPQLGDQSWDPPHRSHSENYISHKLPSPAHDSPTARPASLPPASETQQYHPYRSSASPTKIMHYRDSPLRQSISQQEVPQDFEGESESYGIPPAPPKHRDSGARQLPQDRPPTAYAPEPLRPNPRRPSVDDRSPLQNLEHEYDHFSMSPTASHSLSHNEFSDVFPQAQSELPYMPERHTSRQSYSESTGLNYQGPARQSSYDPYLQSPASYQTPSRQSSYDIYSVQRTSMPLMSPTHERIDVHGRRNSNNALVQERTESRPLHQSERARSYEDRQVLGEYRRNSHDQSSPDLGSRLQLDLSDQCSTPQDRPRPQKYIPTQHPAPRPVRKAVSPCPGSDGSDLSQRRSSNIPFSPDAYDVLNPASSPTTNGHASFQTQEQFKEASRLCEVEKLRDQGPIIGNDGRVIDPSDHLPSDTWAPEPEKKSRKPEHVIHIRTKNDVRGSNMPGSSPVSRMNVHKSTLPSPPVTKSPSSAPPSTGRNRLQKPAHARPLPVQPYQPARSTNDQPGQMSSQHSYHRNSYHDISPNVERPSLSEYQVPTSNSYGVRAQTYQNSNGYGYTPLTISPSEGYFPDRFEDALAAEMSMIDIGPSRGGKTFSRPSPGY